MIARPVSSILPDFEILPPEIDATYVSVCEPERSLMRMIVVLPGDIHHGEGTGVKRLVRSHERKQVGLVAGRDMVPGDDPLIEVDAQKLSVGTEPDAFGEIGVLHFLLFKEILRGPIRGDAWQDDSQEVFFTFEEDLRRQRFARICRLQEIEPRRNVGRNLGHDGIFARPFLASLKTDAPRLCPCRAQAKAD